VREFSVVKDTYGAEYGKRPGAQSTSSPAPVRTRFMAAHMNSSEQRRSTLATLSTTATFQNSNRNAFGGSLGGPLKKDKTFFLWKLRRLPPEPRP